MAVFLSFWSKTRVKMLFFRADAKSCNVSKGVIGCAKQISTI